MPACVAVRTRGSPRHASSQTGQRQFHCGKAPPAAEPQPEDGATYAPKLSREDGRIDWHRTAPHIDRQVRAFDPWPGTFTTLGGQPLKILAASPAEGSGPPGTVLDTALTIACGTGAIRPTRLQLAGRAALDTAAFLRGHPVPPGTVLGA